MIDSLESVDRLKSELDSLRPLEPRVLDQVNQKLRIDANYHSNAIEGNSLTLGETRSLIMHGLTAQGKPLRDHLDIEGHDEAVKAIEAASKETEELTEVFVRSLHKVLLKEPYMADAMTPDGHLVRREIAIGRYKTVPNNVLTSQGEVHYFVPPEQVKQEMGDLIDWYRTKEAEGEHPVIVAATFHYRFVQIHPFDDGNGRMARLLMNMILIRHGYTVAIFEREERTSYISMLEQADRDEDLSQFISYVAERSAYSLKLHLKAARGESIFDIDDIDREIALFKQSLADASTGRIVPQQYLEEMIRPVFEHMQEKTNQLEGPFASVNTFVKVISTTKDGEARTLVKRTQNWPANTLGALEPVKGLVFEARSMMRHFQGKQDRTFWITINGEIGDDGCKWTIQPHVEKDDVAYYGTDVDIVKQHFNEALRHIMRHVLDTESD